MNFGPPPLLQYQVFAAPTAVHPLEKDDVNLDIRQQPKEALVTSDGKEKVRKPVDPPPIIQVTVRQQADPSQHFLQSPYLFMCCSLWKPDEDRPVEEDGPSTLAGSLVSSLHKLKDINNIDGGFFVFGDISVKLIGTFRLHFSLFDLRKDTMEVVFLTSITSKPFRVVAPKDFKGMDESTYLSRAFSDQGVRLRLRKEPRSQKRAFPYPQPPPDQAAIAQSSHTQPNQPSSQDGQSYHDEQNESPSTIKRQRISEEAEENRPRSYERNDQYGDRPSSSYGSYHHSQYPVRQPAGYSNSPPASQLPQYSAAQYPSSSSRALPEQGYRNLAAPATSSYLTEPTMQPAHSSPLSGLTQRYPSVQQQPSHQPYNPSYGYSQQRLYESGLPLRTEMDHHPYQRTTYMGTRAGDAPQTLSVSGSYPSMSHSQSMLQSNASPDSGFASGQSLSQSPQFLRSHYPQSSTGLTMHIPAHEQPTNLATAPAAQATLPRPASRFEERCEAAKQQWQQQSRPQLQDPGFGISSSRPGMMHHSTSYDASRSHEHGNHQYQQDTSQG